MGFLSFSNNRSPKEWITKSAGKCEKTADSQETAAIGMVESGKIEVYICTGKCHIPQEI